MDAAMGGNTDVVKILLSKGVDINAKNNKGETALSIARGKSFSDVVKLLKAAGARE
jgi:ankyrin repeat protein